MTGWWRDSAAVPASATLEGARRLSLTTSGRSQAYALTVVLGVVLMASGCWPPARRPLRFSPLMETNSLVFLLFPALPLLGGVLLPLLGRDRPIACARLAA